MDRDASQPETLRLGRRATLAIGLGCLLLLGCRGFDLRGERFESDPTMDGVRNARQPNEAAADFWGVSNKARQIEGNLGYHKK